MGERHDAAKAENEIERQRKQRRDRDLARQDQIRRRENEWQQGGEPENNLAPSPADLRLQIIARSADRVAAHAGGSCVSMIFSENRGALFGIMLASPEQAERPPHQE